MKNFREEQLNSTTEYCINQYWEKDMIIDDIIITLYYWRRKEGCKGFNGKEGISKVVGVKGNKRKWVRSIWCLNLGEKYCVDLIRNKFN